MGHVYMTDDDEERLKQIAERNQRKVVNQVKVLIDVYEQTVGIKRDDELSERNDSARAPLLSAD